MLAYSCCGGTSINFADSQIKQSRATPVVVYVDFSNAKRPLVFYATHKKL